MRYKSHIIFLVGLIFFAASTSSAQETSIERTLKNRTTLVKMSPLKISGEKDEYYSLHVALSYKYEGTQPQTPEYIDFEIQTVVKTHRLNPDLYIVFLIDDQRVFLSSNRWAVKNAVPGKRLLGERILMRMPLGTYLKLAKADSSVIQMGRTLFEIATEHKMAMLKFIAAPPA